ncbi:MAG: tRNA uridine-5-carboxymethylaminomethyl(34) synthesis GTPase MnmE [Candidatus Latescibacteria bacterium]|nr:tRNA uridine-5-carboxymethylaminomethyl(34) synthesis GTPase MnmE [Candidatus Latescibacterota bacterium]
MLHYHGENDTIAAIATASGKSGIAIVKLSGSRSISLLRKIFKSRKNPEIHERSMIYGHIMDKTTYIDDALVCYMKAPFSYTGEDVVEIQSHGGNAAADTILSLLIEQGARIAEPGEFTKKAFLNGKIDLVQAEAVMQIVAADGREYLRRAEQLMDGSFSHNIEILIEKIKESASLVELNIDFLHQGLEAIHTKELVNTITNTLNSIETLILSYTSARRIKNGVRIVLAGNVNAGKSTLFNTLLGKNRSIVNPTPGTTRDWIEEKIELDGLPVNLVDTAGIRITPDTIEHEGVKGTERLIRDADIVVYLISADEYSLKANISPISHDERYINVITKADILPSINEIDNYILISSLTGFGLEKLKAQIIAKTRGYISNGYTSSIVLVERHKTELTKARDSLKRALKCIGTWSEEIISLELRDAEKHIESILGQNIDYDVLDTIFKNFCIGK